MLSPAERALVDLSIAACLGRQASVARAIGVGRSAALSRPEIEESLLQGALFFGFPRALSAFQTLSATWPGSGTTGRASERAVDRRARGEALFERIYADKHEAVRSMLHALHPDLESFVLECAYGRVLSRDGLDLLRRELCATAVLAALAQEPQLIGHARAAVELGLEPSGLRWILDRAAAAAGRTERGSIEIGSVDRLVRRVLRES